MNKIEGFVEKEAVSIGQDAKEVAAQMAAIGRHHRGLVGVSCLILGYWIIFCGLLADNIIPNLETSTYRQYFACTGKGLVNETLCGPNDNLIELMTANSGVTAPYQLLLYAIPLWGLIVYIDLYCIVTSFWTFATSRRKASIRDVIHDIVVKWGFVLGSCIGFVLWLVKWGYPDALSNLPWYGVAIFFSWGFWMSAFGLLWALLHEIFFQAKGLPTPGSSQIKVAPNMPLGNLTTQPSSAFTGNTAFGGRDRR